MRYLILSQPRTGGSFLCEALQRSGAAGLPFEYLNPAAIAAFSRRMGNESGFSLPALMIALEKRRTGSNGVFGLHLHLEQLMQPLRTIEAAFHWLRRFDRIVFLYRRDKLAQAVSLFRSLQSTVWHKEAHETGERLPDRWDFDPVAISRHVMELSEQEQTIRFCLAGMPARQLELCYEDLDTDFAGSWRRIGAFLDLPPVPADRVYPPLARMRDEASEQMIERYLKALRNSDLVRDKGFRSIPGAGR